MDGLAADDIEAAELDVLAVEVAADCGALVATVAAWLGAADVEDEPDDWETVALDAVSDPDDEVDERFEVALLLNATLDAEDDPVDESVAVAVALADPVDDSVLEPVIEDEVPLLDADEPVVVLLLEVPVVLVPVVLLPVLKLLEIAVEVLDPVAVVLDPADTLALLDPVDTLALLDPVDKLILDPVKEPVTEVPVVERAAASKLSLIFLLASA